MEQRDLSFLQGFPLLWSKSGNDVVFFTSPAGNGQILPVFLKDLECLPLNEHLPPGSILYGSRSFSQYWDKESETIRLLSSYLNYQEDDLFSRFLKKISIKPEHQKIVLKFDTRIVNIWFQDLKQFNAFVLDLKQRDALVKFFPNFRKQCTNNTSLKILEGKIFFRDENPLFLPLTQKVSCKTVDDLLGKDFQLPEGWKLEREGSNLFWFVFPEN